MVLIIQNFFALPTGLLDLANENTEYPLKLNFRSTMNNFSTFNKLIFLKNNFRFIEKLSRSLGTSRTLPTPTNTQPPVIRSPPWRGTCAVFIEPTWTHRDRSMSIAAVGVTIGVGLSLGLDKCLMTCSHNFRVTQSSFTALTSSMASLSFPSPHNPWQPLSLAVSVVLLSPDCHTVAIRQGVTFSHWLLTRSES